MISVPMQSCFSELDPQSIIDEVEKKYSLELTNFCRPLSSYINRVFELRSEPEQRYVVKFYRPDRWTKDAIEEEHQFLFELQKAEIPVIAPMLNKSGQSLLHYKNIYYTLFEYRGGRSSDEFTPEQWVALGRLLGRIHNIGATVQKSTRITMLPHKSFEDQLVYLLDGGFIPGELEIEYENLTLSILEMIEPLFKGREMIRIHGDLHSGNLIQRPDEGFYVLDFDDMAIGVPVQDFWMLLPGYHHECQQEIDLFLQGYQLFRPFDTGSLVLIEALRVMRYIHFCSWCACQVADGAYKQIDESWGSVGFWQKELQDLREQRDRIEQVLNVNES